MNKRILSIFLLLSAASAAHALNPISDTWKQAGKFENYLGIPQNFLRLPGALAVTGASVYAGYKGVMYVLQKLEDAKPTTAIIDKAERSLTGIKDFTACTAIVNELNRSTDHLQRLGHKEALKDMVLAFDNYSSYPFVYFVHDLNRAISEMNNTSYMLERRVSRLPIEEQYYVDELRTLAKKANVIERELRELRAIIVALSEYKAEKHSYELMQHIQLHYNINI
jgi:hypothetical protein